MYLFLGGERRGKERERNIDVREKHQSTVSRIHPDQDWTHNPGMCPDQQWDRSKGHLFICSSKVEDDSYVFAIDRNKMPWKEIEKGLSGLVRK